jgi:diguanylate cyclase (GGDEF)-like protein
MIDYEGLNGTSSLCSSAHASASPGPAAQNAKSLTGAKGKAGTKGSLTRLDTTSLEKDFGRGATPSPQRALPLIVIVLMLMMIATEVGGYLFTSSQQNALIDLRNDTRRMRIVQQALVDEKESLEEFGRTGAAYHLETYRKAAQTSSAQKRIASRRLDEVLPGTRGQKPSESMAALSKVWRTSISLSQAGRQAEASELLNGTEAHLLLDRVREQIASYLEVRNAQGDIYEARIHLGNQLVLGLQIIGGIVTILFLLIAFRMSASEAGARRAAMRKVQLLSDMANMLQSAGGYDDAKAVFSAAALQLLPKLHGSLYIFNNSGDRLELLTSWNDRSGPAPRTSILPSDCWALKRGKPHLNAASLGSPCCAHHEDDHQAFEMPMIARGEVLGLLVFSALADGADGQPADALDEISALADAMSLALSNIALREKLRSQALRDPLTGLYNRRYMEDMLQRLVLVSERSGAPLSVIMIDLDHFKRLNDEHGHLLGDTVLRSVASSIMGALRESDVACRYGGEELTVLLPDCALQDALVKAELLRSRIEQLSDLHGVKISASFGVASRPETSAGITDLLSASDAALYRAKREGRNRVAAADLAPSKRPIPLAAE